MRGQNSTRRCPTPPRVAGARGCNELIQSNEPFLVGLYIRVSTTRQAKEGDSLEEQEDELKKYCEYRGFRIHRIYIESGRSGGNTDRPEYQRLVRDIKSGKVNAVVVKKLDRISRSALDFEQLIRVLQDHNVEFISLKESFDTSNAMGKAMLRIAIVFAQLEREQTSERVKDIIAFRSQQGLFNGGVPPYGYANVNKELVSYEREKVMVQHIFNQFADCKSTTAVAKYLNESGYRNRNGKLWDKRRIDQILKNPVYIGKVRHRDDIYQGIHQPIIGAKQFEQIQFIFKNQGRLHSKSKPQALLRQLIMCGCCNRSMTPSHSLNHSKKKFHYYRCKSTESSEKGRSKCTVKNVPFERAEDWVVTALLSLSEGQCFSEVNHDIKLNNQSIEAKANDIRESIKRLETNLEIIKDKKDRFFDSLFTNTFSSSERAKINKRIDEIELEQKQLQATLTQHQISLSDVLENVIDLTVFKQLLVSFKTDFDTFSHLQLRQFLVTHIDQVFYLPESLKIQFKALPWTVSFQPP